MDTQIDFVVTTASKGDLQYRFRDVGTYTVLFEIKENEKATIVKLNNDLDLFLEICEESLDNHLKEISNESICFNSNNEQHPPLTYKILTRNRTSGEQRTSFYKINPLSSTNINGYENIIETILNFNEYQLFDDEISTFGGKISPKFNGRKYFESVLNSLSSNAGKILIALNHIEKNPICFISKFMQKSFVEKKQTRKTTIKNSQKNGALKITNETKKISYDNDANKYLLYILEISEKELVCFKSRLNQAKTLYLDKKEEKIKNAKPDKSPDAEEQYNFAIRNLDAKINRIISFDSSIKDLLNAILKVRTTTLKNIRSSSKKTKEFYLNRNYSIIEQYLFTPLIRSRFFSPFSINNLCVSSIRPTYQLFEIYCLVKIFEFIENHDFVCLDELYYDNDQKLNHLSWSFKSGSSKIIVSYEVDATNYSNGGEQGVYYINESTNVSPDFYIIVTKNNETKLFLVLDAKCRRKKDIKKALKDKESTVRNYYSFRYATSAKDVVEGKNVDALAFLYPSEDGLISREETFLYWMVPFRLDKNESLFFNFLESMFAKVN